MNKYIISRIIAVVIFQTNVALSGGSTNLSEINTLLIKQKNQWVEILSVFELEDSVTASRFGRNWEYLSGTRCGPYAINAKEKGIEGDYTHEIIVTTNLLFYGKNGELVSENVANAPKDSFKIVENLKSIVVLSKQIADLEIKSLPLDSKYINNISQAYYNENKYYGGYHTGIDISTPNENPEVYAVADGEIVWNSTNSSKYVSDYDKYFNAFLIIKHKDFYAYYGHLYSNFNLNEKVSKGKPLGKIRDAYSEAEINTNNNHLHISISTGEDWEKSGWGYKKSAASMVAFEDPKIYLNRFIQFNMCTIGLKSENGHLEKFTINEFTKQNAFLNENKMFVVNVIKAYKNSALKIVDRDENGATNRGVGQRIKITELPIRSDRYSTNIVSVIMEIKIKSSSQSLGTWMLSESLNSLQAFEYSGVRWQLGLLDIDGNLIER